MKNNRHLHLYQIRLKIAGIQNILDMIQVMASVTEVGRLEKARLEIQRPFRNLLFALAVRCSGLLEGISFQLETVQPSRKMTVGELAGIKDFISRKRKEVSQAQLLLEKGSLNVALKKLAKSKEGFGEVAERMDRIIESRMQ